VKDNVRAAGYPLNTRHGGQAAKQGQKKRGPRFDVNFGVPCRLLVWFERAPTNSEQKVIKRTKLLSDEPYKSSFPSFPFVHDIRAIRVISGYTFGCGGAALGHPRLICFFQNLARKVSRDLL
jgi:hypothetical protein